ncbi:hepatocyte growth factor receptor-like [Planococcus citri]|uniref:hepatocyte growth factor receptor-like n=1 Tax=Planococcus citri TaxID=170843 RepID=UPI0031F722F0
MVLYIGATITTNQSNVHAMSTLELDSYPESLYFADSITLKDAYQGKYIITYIYGFASTDFFYFLTTRMNSTQPSIYTSKLIRNCQDIEFLNYYYYTEIPIECYDENQTKYNLAQAAFVGKPGSELANSLGITLEDDVLFGIFAQSEKQTVGFESSKPSNRSAMCIYSLKEINEKFTENIQRCFNGTGYRGLEFMNPPDLKCENMNQSIESMGSKFCRAPAENMPLEGNSPVKTNASITFDTLVTAVRAQSYPNNFTGVFVGTNTGHLNQIVVENKFNTYKYKDIAIDEGFAINSDLHFDSETDHLYIMTEQKLTKIKISFHFPSISSFQPTVGLLGEIINVTIIGNNLACSSNNIQHSIAVAGIPCAVCRPLRSAEIVCTINTRSMNSAELEVYEGPVEIQGDGIKAKSKQKFVILDPKIERIFPTEGSLYGGNKLIINGKNFIAKSSLDVYIGNVSCLVFHHDQNEITCITGPSPILTNNIAIKFNENFRIFNYTYKYFDTDLDGKGHNLTLKGIPAGGITIFMHNPGLNKASIGKLFFQVNNNSQTYNGTKCGVENSTTFTCLSPHMPDIDSYSLDTENPQVFKYTLMVSLNRTNAGNPLSIKSSKFFVYPNPVFEHYSVTELDENIRFVIKGRNIDNACRVDDFIVRVGDKNCTVFILSQSDLTCQVQKSALKYDYSKNTTELDFSTAYVNVTVQIGNNAEQVVPYLEAGTPVTTTKESEYNNWIIYTVCFGAIIFVVIIFVLIKLLIGYRKRSFKSLKISREMQQQINKMGMDAIAMRQCIKQIVVEKKIDVDGSLANILKLPNITIAYTPVTETNVETSPEMEFYLPLDTKWEFPREKLVLGRFLGEGEFGRVVQSEASGIIDENITTTVAVKMLKVKHSDADMIDLVSEMEIMKLIGMHSNVLRLLGCCTQNGPLLIITEYAVHGNLLSFLHKHLASENFETAPSELSQRTLVTFGLQVARGMEYLSSMKCVHRDLAARNILVSDNQILKIADFGLARDIKNKDYYRKKSGGKLPVKWMAPEALLHKLYTVQSDVWSYGILLWEIMTLGGSPYPTFTDMKKLLRDLHSGYRMEKPPKCSMEMYSIMRQCWNYVPKDRPSFSAIVENLEEILQSTGDDEILEESDSYESSSIDSDCSETGNEALEGDHLLLHQNNS